jgi:hypothetical protein
MRPDKEDAASGIRERIDPGTPYQRVTAHSQVYRDEHRHPQELEALCRPDRAALLRQHDLALGAMSRPPTA